MTQNFVQQIEQEFQQLKKQTTEQVWNDSQKLIILSEQLESKNLLLARRVLQRAKNLTPKNSNVLKAIEAITQKIRRNGKGEGMVVSSIEPVNKPQISRRQKVKQIVKKNIPITLNKNDVLQKIKTPIFSLVLFPIFCFAFYQVLWASPRYESISQVLVQQPDGMATMDPSMALLTGLGVSSSGISDAEILKTYVYSEDMLNYLNTKHSLTTHYSDSQYDFFSRLTSNASKEDLVKFYTNNVAVEIDETSGIIKVLTQGFTPEFAKQVNKDIVNRAEWYINSIGHQLAEAQLTFIRNEHKQVEKRLEFAKKNLLAFQQTYNLLDPEAEGAAFQQITYSLESEIASKSAELKGLRLVMTEKAPQVMVLKAQLNALKTQLSAERERLSLQKTTTQPPNTKLTTIADPLKPNTSNAVSEMLAQYSDYKIELELALQAYTSSEISLEKSRIEAYRQLKYLITVESSTLPEDHQYPNVFYNISLFSVILLMLYGIGNIILATVKELK